MPPGQGLHKTDVIRVERALRKKGLKANADVDGFAGTDFRAAYGKWHVGEGPGRWPTDKGFEEWYGPPRTYERHSGRPILGTTRPEIPQVA